MSTHLETQSRNAGLTLRLKTLMVVGQALIILLLLLYVSSHIILLNGFIQIEEQDTRQNVERALNALWDRTSVLHTTTKDWAHWDDTYQFMQDHNIAYLDSNVIDSSFINHDINVMAFVEASGKMVFGKGYDLYTQQTGAISDNLHAVFNSDSPLLNHQNDTGEFNIEGTKGILSLPEGPMLVASVPILTGEQKGPSPGSLIWGLYLDSAQVRYIAEKTELLLTLYPVNETALPEDFQTARNFLTSDTLFVQPLSSESVAGYSLLTDVFGNPAIILRIEMPRVIYAQGQASLSYFIIALLVIGLILGGVILLMLEKMVLSRLADLSKSVDHIRLHGDLSTPIVITGRDELSNLAQGMAGMIESLHESQQRLQKAHDELEKRVEQRTTELSETNTLLRREITEHQQTQMQLAQARDHALESLRLKSQILANVSHDARTPLSSIMLRADLLQRGIYGQVNEKQIQTLDVIILSVRQLLSFFNNLLTEAQLSNQKVQVLHTPFFVAKFVEELYRAMAPLAEQKGLHLQTVIEANFPEIIQSDSERLRQILTNLIDNAIKFTDQGVITITIAQAGLTHWTLSVQDHGRGIPNEAQAHIFEAFWQVDGSMTREVNRGIGLGLSIVKQLTTLLDGEITLQSEAGQGTCFTLTFPLHTLQEEKQL